MIDLQKSFPLLPRAPYTLMSHTLTLPDATQPQKRRAKEKEPTTTMPQPPRQPQQSTAPAHLKELLWPDNRNTMGESPGSPLRSQVPEKPSSPSSRGAGSDGCNALVSVETYYSPPQSPLPVTPPTDSNTPENVAGGTTTSSSLVVSLGRIVSAKTTSSALVVGSTGGGGETGGVFGFRKWTKKKEEEGVVEEIVSRSRKKVMLLRAALVLRVYEFVFSLVSFSIMAADSTQGWSGDSFYRYKEYRYCLSINVIAFAYAAFEAFNLTYNLVSGKQFIKHHLHHHFAFLIDQILAYLLISASSAAATRVDNWQTNWGKDEFTEKAGISASMSFLAFIGFALSSIISGHNLCNA